MNHTHKQAERHQHHDHHSHRRFNKKRLIYAIIITLATLIIEVIGGILSNSLALLSDAAHMFSHLFALTISYAAILLALRPVDTEKTYGYYRSEILAAFVNGITLFIIIAAILYGAYERSKHPLDIHADQMLIVAALGLIVNVITAMLLRSRSREDINIKGAFLHALGDMISSVGVVAAAVVIHFTGLAVIDTIVSIFIALIITYWAIQLIRNSAHILLEGRPKELDVDKVISTMEGIIGRSSLIHHIHTWQISTNIYALTAHISIDHINQHEATRFIADIKRVLKADFNIHHTTIQFECRSCDDIDLNSNTMDGRPCPTTDRHGT